MSMNLSDFDFELPQELIAESPLDRRDASKLLHVNPSGDISDKKFTDIVELVNKGDVLVFNNTKVIKARLRGNIGEAKAEITLIKKVSEENSSSSSWDVLAKPAKKFKQGRVFHINNNFEAKIIENIGEGVVRLSFNVDEVGFFKKVEEYGQMPLPPYIERKRKADESDEDRYQTVYAKKEGAVAAPTAGLHFTDGILKQLKDKGIKIAEVTLHVSAGTFLPVKVENILEHKMHSEYFEINEENSEIINEAKRNNGRVISVGTTSMRVLETVAEKGKLEAKSGETDIFIYPGYNFKIVDCLVTNFHLPKSTLFMLISALISADKAKEAYQRAVENSYRFFSYGDSNFLEKKI